MLTYIVVAGRGLAERGCETPVQLLAVSLRPNEHFVTQDYAFGRSVRLIISVDALCLLRQALNR